MEKACGKQNLTPWMDSSPLNEGECTVYPAYPCCCNSLHFIPCQQSCFLPSTPEMWIFLLVLYFGRREACNELQLFNQTPRAPISQPALNDEHTTCPPPPRTSHQKWAPTTHGIGQEYLDLLPAQSSLHFAVITRKSSPLAEFNLHPSAVKAVTSFWRPIQAG